MPRRNYYVHYYDLSLPNAYRLYYVQYAEDLRGLPEGARISTRQNVIALARQERIRRAKSRSDSGFADVAVFPASYRGDPDLIGADGRYVLRECVWVLASDPAQWP